ncbi:uncharacterized protein LOC132758449 isoform X2 [Ruditapes philippinarum]|uniref:uncharacterized protein LOC132758449 isoform X2 n=1 Tax=Ruditapes philippinarum TaxID=129788 RepID=UPI00295BFF35|nr:uncharacterized protein LOC132758449 isoform X2 [Ruditapes philippinarum]
MAAKESLLQYLMKYENDDRKDCAAIYDPACPVLINFCDASAKGKRFPESTVDFSVCAGFPLACFQLISLRKLLSYLQGKTEAKEHEECLLSLVTQQYNKYNIQVILAAHLFGPLAGSYKIGINGFPKNARCPRCNKDISEAVQNTSLGNGDVWHGYDDILVNRCLVKIGTEDNKVDGIDEPEDESGEEESSTSDECYVSDSVVKNDAKGYQTMSQALAQTIVNAFSEVNKNSELSCSFIPSFIATCKDIRITMYNSGFDSLIMSSNMKIFMSHDNKTILNISTILSVWYALNYDNFFDKVVEGDELFPQFHSEILYKKSNFKEQAGEMYEIYKEKCTKPMTETKRDQDVVFKISTESFTGPLNSLIKESILSLRSVVKQN